MTHTRRDRMQDVTTELARFVARSRLDAIGESIRDEAVRSLVNWLGCALGGCLDPSIDAALASLSAAPGRNEATLLGRGERTDIGSAAFVGAIAASILDYGDTHPTLGITVAPAVAAALLPLAEARSSPGTDVLHAFILGAESACRSAAAGFSQRGGAQHDDGIVCGALGAAAACARLLALDEQATARALESAATRAAAHLPGHSSSADAWRFGTAACEGLRAALLAAQTTDGSPASDAAGAVSTADAQEPLADWNRGLGTDWWFTASDYHAYPCRHALHPTIEAARQLKSKHRLNARSIEAVIVRLSPSRLRAVDAPQPKTAGEARRSVQHVVAAALLDGQVGLRHFEPARLGSPRVQALRARVRVDSDPCAADDGGSIAIELRDGGSIDTPLRSRPDGGPPAMDDAALNAKFRTLAAETLATDQAERVLALAWNIAVLADIGALVRASVPQDDLEAAELPGSPLLPR